MIYYAVDVNGLILCMYLMCCCATGVVFCCISNTFGPLVGMLYRYLGSAHIALLLIMDKTDVMSFKHGSLWNDCCWSDSHI